MTDEISEVLAKLKPQFHNTFVESIRTLNTLTERNRIELINLIKRLQDNLPFDNTYIFLTSHLVQYSFFKFTDILNNDSELNEDKEAYIRHLLNYLESI